MRWTTQGAIPSKGRRVFFFEIYRVVLTTPVSYYMGEVARA
jgi:hypothetical protein